MDSNKRLKVGESDSPRRKKEQEPDGFNLLFENEDLLLQVLLRTDAKDHGPLRCSCKTFQRVLDSRVFRQERLKKEWAQVHIPVEKMVLDERDGGFRVMHHKARIFVDGKEAGSAELVYVNRRVYEVINDPFPRSVYDEYEDDNLINAVNLFFTDMARPKLNSLREATKGKDHEKKDLLFIESLDLSEEYRRHTWVGACALGLMHTFEFRRGDRTPDLTLDWGIAIYIGTGRRQLVSENDFRDQERLKALMNKQFHARMNNQEALSEEEEREKADLESKLEALDVADLRPFLRAGFEQPNEVVARRDHYFVFCAIDNLICEPSRMMTGQEAEALPILPRVPGPEPEEDCADFSDDDEASHDESDW